MSAVGSGLDPQIEILADGNYTSGAAAHIAQLIASRLKSGAAFCSIGLCGGSTPGGIYRELAAHAEVDWSKVKLFLGDERWVNESDPQSNTRMIRETLFGAGSAAAPARLFAPDTTLDCATGAVRYADTLIQELGAKVEFDVMLLGVGDDGHTASIFPHSELLHSAPDICAVARHPVNHSTRITVTRPVLERSRTSVFLAKGAAKAEILQRIVTGDEPTEALPVKMFRGFTGAVHFVIDASAGALLR